MTTSSTTLSAKRVRRGANEYPAGSLGFDLVVALLSSVFIVGLFLDGWAHNNIPDLIETFFTPYHALLYGGAIQTAGMVTKKENRKQTVSDWMHQTRPPTWALVLMREWQESERQRYLVESLKNFRSVLDAL